MAIGVLISINQISGLCIGDGDLVSHLLVGVFLEVIWKHPPTPLKGCLDILQEWAKSIDDKNLKAFEGVDFTQLRLGVQIFLEVLVESGNHNIISTGDKFKFWLRIFSPPGANLHSLHSRSLHSPGSKSNHTSIDRI